MSNFPVELVENVLEHVYGEYRPLEKPHTLCQCALVCRTWNAIAETLILFEISNRQLQTRGEDEKTRRLVRRFWIKPVPGISIDELAACLPNLQEMYVVTTATSVRPFAQGNHLILRNLTTLGLSTILFPVRLFHQCAGLRDLKINCCRADLDGELPPTTPPVRLRSFHYRAESMIETSIFQWMLSSDSAFDLTGLTTIRTSDRTDLLEAYALVQDLVTRCASTLQDLMIDPPTRYATADPKITSESLLHPSKLHNLRTIRISIIQIISDYTNYVPWMTAFFSSLPIDTQLEEVFLPCTFSDGSLDGAPTGVVVSQCGWEKLDAALSSLRRLKRLVLCIYHFGIEDETLSSESLTPDLMKGFPRLSEKGMLEIKDSTKAGQVSINECWWNVDF